jgi:Ca-activated chloride channel family protein
MAQDIDKNDALLSATLLTLQPRSERRLLRKSGGECAIDFLVQVAPAPEQKGSSRASLRLALVLDRSGSMQGEKLKLAKRATLAVLDHLSGRDSVAVVTFDNQIDVIQSVAPVTPALKRQVQATLQHIEARASTALHEGWLTGCNALTGDVDSAAGGELARCFLLTDGIANVGMIDPERIASEAAGVREHTAISTSTFGIGHDYNELLLGPMAVAGGGQFHHLRSPDEIYNTFVGELGELLQIAARQVRLEIELESGLKMELISAYWLDAARTSIALGDLQYGEERHAVIRVQFPAQWSSEKRIVRARLLWFEGKDEHSSAWQELQFFYAGDPEWEAETRDAQVVEILSLQEADRARREALALNKRGDYSGAHTVLQKASGFVAHNVSASPALQSEVDSLHQFASQMPASAPMAPAAAKEQYYQQQRRSRNQADYRGPQPQAEEEKQ